MCVDAEIPSYEMLIGLFMKVSTVKGLFTLGDAKRTTASITCSLYPSGVFRCLGGIGDG